VAEIYNDGGGKFFNLQNDFGNYTSSASLQSWWLVGKNPVPNLCDDEQGLIDMNSPLAVDDTDREEDAPGIE